MRGLGLEVFFTRAVSAARRRYRCRRWARSLARGRLARVWQDHHRDDHPDHFCGASSGFRLWSSSRASENIEASSSSDGVDAELEVFVLGLEDISPQGQFLLPPPGVRREVHASGLLAAFGSRCRCFPPQLMGLRSTGPMNRLVGKRTTAEEGLVLDSAKILKEAFQEEFDRRGYRGDALNVAAAGLTRFENLLRGSQGRLLDTVELNGLRGAAQAPGRDRA